MTQREELSVTVPASERLLLDRQSAADMLSVSIRALDGLPIPRVRPGGGRTVRYRRCDLEMYVRSLVEPQ